MIEEKYGKPTLNSYRKVLVGYLVAPSYFIAPSQGFHIYKLSSLNVKAFQSMDKTIKTPITSLQDPVNMGDESKRKDDQYTDLDRLYDKLTMMDYISSLPESEDIYIGMMEMYDNRLNVYTFIAIPGSQEKFLKDNEITSYIQPGAYQKRPDISVSDVFEKSKNGNSEQPIPETGDSTSTPVNNNTPTSESTMSNNNMNADAGNTTNPSTTSP